MGVVVAAAGELVAIVFVAAVVAVVRGGVAPRGADLPIAVDAGAFKHVKGIRAFLKHIEVLFGDAAHNVYIYIYMLISII